MLQLAVHCMPVRSMSMVRESCMSLNTTARWIPLRHYLYLQHQRHQELTLGFRQIEGILGDALPKPARKYPEWWANDNASDQARAWLAAGWQVRCANLADEQVTFEHAEQ